MNIQNVEVEIRVNGRPVRSYNHEGKVFVESRENTEYTIHVKNNNWHRVLAVPSVDGISVLDGKKATHDSIGYILEAYQAYEIKGFRKDYSTCGAFKFTKKGGGYAESKGDAQNVGIISLAIFKEKIQPIVYQCTYTYPTYTFTSPPVTYTSCGGNLINTQILNQGSNNLNTANFMLSCVSNSSIQEVTRGTNNENTIKATSFSHSTKWGNKIEDKVTSGSFERDVLIAQFDIYYGSKEDLKIMGIDIVPKKQLAFPQGFDNKFCEPPINWKS
jgi:hypothetical protein